jgi:hypothetical protein
MGLGFSIENGGHFAHLHFGLYPGPFDLRHNYGYKSAKDGLADWYDPAAELPRWIDRTRPLVEEPRGFGASLTRVVARIRRNDLGRAFSEAREARDGSEPGGETYVEAMALMDAIRQAPQRAVERAEKWRDGGYPTEALRRLKQDATSCKGVPGAEVIGETRREWEADALFQRALKGEARIASTAAPARKLKDPGRVRALWEKLLESYADTCLAERISSHVRAAPD